MKSLNQFITSKVQNPLKEACGGCLSYISQQHTRGKASAQKPNHVREGSFATSKSPPSQKIKRKEDTENIWWFLMSPCTLKLFDNLPQRPPITFSIMNNSLGATGRAFHGLNPAGLLWMPHFQQFLQATLNFLLSPNLPCSFSSLWEFSQALPFVGNNLPSLQSSANPLPPPKSYSYTLSLMRASPL